MITITCPSCGKKLVWDDFQPLQIRCTKCGERINVHKAFKQNIHVREHGSTRGRIVCPHCRAVIPRRWFVKCPSCGYWVFGKAAFYDKLATVILIGIAYIIFSAVYLIYFH